jgi:hypothetical protein
MTTAIFLAVLSERLTAALIAPLFDKLKLDRFYLMYAAWIIGALLVWLSGVNLFADYLPELAGRILTAIVAGGGANLIHDVLDFQDIIYVEDTEDISEDITEAVQ